MSTDEERLTFALPDKDALPGVTIKGLYEKLELDPAEVAKVREQLVQDALLKLQYIFIIRKNGGAIHNVNVKATAKRRAANKVAAKQRRTNRARRTA